MRLPWDSKEKVERKAGTYQRERSSDLYHTARWTRLSIAWRRDHPLCEECRRNGLIVEGEVTDHIIPWPICGDFFDMNNYQTLCRRCNMLKGERDRATIQEWKRTHSDG